MAVDHDFEMSGVSAVNRKSDSSYDVNLKKAIASVYGQAGQRAVPRVIEDTSPVTNPNEAKSIDQTLKERGSRYGAFNEHAQITQDIKAVMWDSDNWRQGKISKPQREALEMIAHKIGRILNGDPNYKDSWTDIIGYARLIEKELKDETGPNF